MDNNNDDGITFADLRLKGGSFAKIEGGPFKVPPEVLQKPELIFGYHVAVLYGTDAECREELAEAFDVSKQSIWIWRRGGVAPGRRKRLQEVLDDPSIKLRLAENVEIDDLMRPVGQMMTRGGEQYINDKWLDFLQDIESEKYAGWSRKDIAAIADFVNLTPVAVYRWGWVSGGVSPTFSEKIWRYFVERGLHHAMNMSEDDFIAYCEENFQGRGTRRERPVT